MGMALMWVFRVAVEPVYVIISIDGIRHAESLRPEALDGL